MRSIFFLLFLLSFQFLSAQYTEVYRSGRPGFFYGPYSIGTGTLAWESGFGYQAFPNTREGFTFYPQLLRVGVSEKLEIRTFVTLQQTGFGSVRLPGSQSLALTDIGFRYRFTENKGGIPAVALEMIWATPWVSEAFQPRFVRPYFFISTDNQLTSSLNLITNFGLDFNNFGWQGLGFFRLALVNGFTDALAAYVEVAGNRGLLANLFQVDGGLTYMLSKDIQADLSGGFGNFGAVPYFYWEAGLSFRFPSWVER